ncbi:hypothetical protein MPH_06468 [Macrophomina phaseolina MS6]|uniref:Uncharacterized protein n=1 Tax=Macrophomina phaseolina (strain MS6) TaxID=1126212 RepID=K2R272_MACPH|nr:hypothetical protein MPH_06468 [Macrophomina phaseolina MS6]
MPVLPTVPEYPAPSAALRGPGEAPDATVQHGVRHRLIADDGRDKGPAYRQDSGLLCAGGLVRQDDGIADEAGDRNEDLGAEEDGETDLLLDADLGSLQHLFSREFLR